MMRRTGRSLVFSNAAMAILDAYSWPGNVRELNNVIEHACWMTLGDEITAEDLPPSIARRAVASEPQTPGYSIAERWFAAMSAGQARFWDDIYPRFLSRDLTRSDVRELVRRGLSSTNGNYRALLPLFGVPTGDYKRFLNFLAAHECTLDYRGFRGASSTRRPMAN